MKLAIDERILAENNLTLNEYLVLLLNAKEGDVHECIASLIAKGWGGQDLFDDSKIVLSDNAKELVFNVLVDSDKLVEDKQDDFEALAEKLKAVFPEGRKAGTTYSWRGSTAEVARKLKNLVVKYGCKFTHEEAIEATKAYVASFNGDYKYMKVLKYFLLKTPRNNNGDVEIESSFMDYLENKKAAREAVERNNGNWAVDLA